MEVKSTRFWRKKSRSEKAEKSSDKVSIKMHAPNPFSIDAAFQEGNLIFKCPTCQSKMGVALSGIKPVIGINVLCDNCKNVAHVPGDYGAKPKPAGLKITGSVRVAISEFKDWYYSHPLVDSLIKSGQSDLLNDYGLWGFCANCYHRYQRTVLNIFPLAQSATGFFWGARTPESAKDFNSLNSGRCPSCGHNSLIVIVAEIPNHVRRAILSQRGEGRDVPEKAQ